METKRAYYTCPVMAMLALKHGIKLVQYISSSGCWIIKEPREIADDFEEEPEDLKYHIALESMHLLEPDRDDPIYLGKRNGQHSVGFAGNHTLTDLIENGYEIMRRNNKPFPWPEFEEVESEAS